MKMNKSHLAVGCGRVAAAVIAAGLAASLGVLAPSVAVADEAAATTLEATTQQDPATQAADEPKADTDVVAAAPVAPATEDAADDQPAAGAETPAANPVAKIGDKTYASFDEAVADAKDGATIELLQDAETKGLNLKGDLTIDGGADRHSLTFNDKGIAVWEHALTFKNVDASMSRVGSTPYGEWNWMSICASKGGSLTLDAATLTMDGTGTASNVHAIYFCSNNKLNITNGSNLTIKNYKQDALEWDGGDGHYNVNITGGSTYTSDHNRSGFTGTFGVTIDGSHVNVVNSTGNGSNGSHFNIVNGSVVDFSGNGSHGLSAGNLTVDDSTVTASNNALTGIIFTGKGEFKNGANVQISGTRGTSYWSAGMRLKAKGASLKVDAASTVSITGNKVTGLFLDAGSQATFAEGANLTITGNDASSVNCSAKKELAQMGGGVVVRGGSSLTLPASAVIDNNNAALAGDDLYVEEGGTLTFGAAHNDALTEFDGCGHDIDGWYDDAAASRWSAHGESNHVAAVQSGTLVAKEGPVALKAAHGLVSVDYKYVGDAPEGAKVPDADTDLELGAAYTAKAQQPVDGYTFDGWYTDEACTTKWNDGDALTGSMMLYGKWTKNPAAPTTPDAGNKTPDKKLPQTGDTTSAALPALLAGGSLAALGAGIALRRREH